MQEPPATPHKVLHLITRNQRRGAETFAFQLLEAFTDRSFVHAVRPLYGADGFGEPIPHVPVDVRVLGRLMRTVRNERPDIVLAHGSATLKYAAAASIVTKIPSIVYRNIGTASYWADSQIKVRFNKTLLRRVDCVVSMSEHTRLDFLNVYNFPPSRARSIPKGVDIAPFDQARLRSVRQRMRRDLGIADDELAIATVGSLSEEKNPGACLEIAAALHRKGLPVRYLIVGGGPLRPELEKRSQAMGTSGYVDFLGVRQDVPEVLAACDLFVLPSWTEGMPGVVIEAGLAVLASVAYDVGGVGEAVWDGETGFVVPRGDQARLIQAAERLLRDQALRREMGEKACRRCIETFDMRKVAHAYEGLFREVVQHKSRCGGGKAQEEGPLGYQRAGTGRG